MRKNGINRTNKEIEIKCDCYSKNWEDSKDGFICCNCRKLVVPVEMKEYEIR